MSASDSANGRPSERRPEAEPPRSLFERLRELVGLGGASVRDDIEDAIEGQGPSGEFTAHERTLLRNVLQLHDVRVADLMVPRADIIALSLDSTVEDALRTFRAAAHSRLPVYHETLDDPRGMIHIRDFVEFLGPADPNVHSAGRAAPLRSVGLVRAVLFAPASMPALDLLTKMQASRTHMALVVDEYGGTDGLVSIEDLVEAIVGDIEDEHDEDESPPIAVAADGSCVVDARAPLEDVSKAIGFDFVAEANGDDVDTIGGFVVARAGRVPSRGEILSGPGEFEFDILDADPRRVKRIKIRPAFGRPKKPAARGEATKGDASA